MKASNVWILALIVALTVAPAAAAKKEKKAGADAAATTVAATDVVAYVGDVAISKQELDVQAGADLQKVRQQEYDARKRALDGMIMQKLLDGEAKSRNVPLPDLLKAEVEDKAGAPTDAEVSEFYEKNKGRLQGKTLDQAKPEIEGVLKQQKLAARRAAFQKELRDKSKVRILLDAPRVDVPAIPATWPGMRGPQNAPVTLIEYSDYQCPLCRRAEPTVSQLLTEYGDKIRFVYRDYPLQFHQRAMPASIAAHCGAEQGKYWQFHENLMKEQGDLSDDDLKKRATAIGLDGAKFAACFEAKKVQPAIDVAFKEGQSLGVTGTPSFFVNGRMIVGAKPIDEFKALIQEELDRASAQATAKK